MVNQHGSMLANCHGTKSARPRMITNEIRSRELADPLLNECYVFRQSSAGSVVNVIRGESFLIYHNRGAV